MRVRRCAIIRRCRVLVPKCAHISARVAWYIPTGRSPLSSKSGHCRMIRNHALERVCYGDDCLFLPDPRGPMRLSFEPSLYSTSKRPIEIEPNIVVYDVLPYSTALYHTNAASI